MLDLKGDQMNKSKPKEVLISLKRDEESSQIETQKVNLSAPRWGWHYLQERANALYGGDVNLAINEVFSKGLEAFVELSTYDPEPINKIPC
jgi:hypothetical protein